MNHKQWDLPHTPQTQLISATIAAPNIEPVQFLHQAAGQERFFWQAAHDNTAFAGCGIAADLTAWGPSRVQSIAQQAQALFANACISANARIDANACISANAPTQARPRLFGGFAFRHDFTPDNTWAVFHPAQFILPHYQLTAVADQRWLTINALVPTSDDPDQSLADLYQALHAKYQLLTKQTAVNPPLPNLQQQRYPMSNATWRQLIEEATHAMKTGPLNKVVLSRVCELWFDQPLPSTAVLPYLNQAFPDCYRFLFEPRPYHTFYGATPELLLQVDGRQLTTMALASSIRRGQTAAEDAALGQTLLQSPKDAEEHRIVVDSIRRRLQPLVSHLTIPDAPQLLTLGYIHHLYTPIHGRLSHNSGVLPFVEQLHPTPALGGSPRELALPYISQAEPVPRGWYAGPIGWLDANLDGAFAVAIRSAVAQERRVWLHAGAGIVASSDPQKEWDETALKFKPMLNALGLKESLSHE